jgi:hypothetical protein
MEHRRSKRNFLSQRQTHTRLYDCNNNHHTIIDSSVGIVLGYVLGDRVQFQAGDENSSLRHRVQTGSAAHPASYPMGIGGKAAKA